MQNSTHITNLGPGLQKMGLSNNVSVTKNWEPLHKVPAVSVSITLYPTGKPYTTATLCLSLFSLFWNIYVAQASFKLNSYLSFLSAGITSMYNHAQAF